MQMQQMAGEGDTAAKADTSGGSGAAEPPQTPPKAMAAGEMAGGENGETETYSKV